MDNFSSFDKKVKLLILKSKWREALDLINKFSEKLKNDDEHIVFYSLLKYYSINNLFRPLLIKNYSSLLYEIQQIHDEIKSFEFITNPKSKILVILPSSSFKSAGNLVLHKIVNLLHLNGIPLDELIYTKETNFDFLFQESKTNYHLVIVPETLSHIPNINTKNVLIYHGNILGKLPQIKLGSRKIESNKSINYVHSHSIDKNMKRLFISTIDFHRFKPTHVNRVGGTAIYLGKYELSKNFRFKLSLVSKEFNTNLIFTRNYPKTQDLTSFAKQLDLLVTLDPISSINLEFAVAGCPVFFANLYDYYNTENINSYELTNKNFRLFNNELNLLPFSEQLENHFKVMELSQKLQKIDEINFINHVNSLVMNNSLPS